MKCATRHAADIEILVVPLDSMKARLRSPDPSIDLSQLPGPDEVADIGRIGAEMGSFFHSTVHGLRSVYAELTPGDPD
jgi:hypothetical protein